MVKTKVVAVHTTRRSTPIEPLYILLHPEQVYLLDEYPGAFSGKEVHVVTWEGGKPTSKVVQTAEGDRIC